MVGVNVAWWDQIPLVINIGIIELGLRGVDKVGAALALLCKPVVRPYMTIRHPHTNDRSPYTKVRYSHTNLRSVYARLRRAYRRVRSPYKKLQCPVDKQPFIC